MDTHLLAKKRHLVQGNMKRVALNFFTEYETPKMVLIHSTTFGILLRVMQIILFIYSVAYLLLYEKGYQKKDSTIVSSVTLKVKGIGYIQRSPDKTVVIDVADYIIPPSENNAMFIMTNYIRTDQNRSRCMESLTLKEALCKSDDDCQNRLYISNMNGRWTGRCILRPEIHYLNGTENITKQLPGLCEMNGWCPAENDLKPANLVHDVRNFTIFVKNFIEFPAFDVKHKNMVDNLKPCIFHPTTQKDCPIFSIDYMLGKAEIDTREQELMLRLGGVIRVKIEWDCNLDRKIKLCKPAYSFARLDVPFRDKPFSVGFNFRFASHWKQNQTHYRTLTKAYGLRLIIDVSGQAGKFHFITLTLNTGSLVGIFGLATFFCDLILLHISRKARTYRSHVFERVHLHTRVQSVLKQRREPVLSQSEEVLNRSDSNVATTSSISSDSYGTPPSRQQSGKTVAARPLTLIGSNQMPLSSQST